MSRFYSFKCLDPAGREVSYWRGDAKNRVCLKRDQTDLFHPKDVRHDDVILVPASGGNTELKVVEIAYADTNEWTTVPRPKVSKVTTEVPAKKTPRAKKPKQLLLKFNLKGKTELVLQVAPDSQVARYSGGGCAYVRADAVQINDVIWHTEANQYGIVQSVKSTECT